MSITIGLIGGASGKELTEYIQKFGFTVALVIGKADEPGSDIADHILVTDLRNIEQVYSWLKELGVKKLIIGTGLPVNIYAFTQPISSFWNLWAVYLVC